MVRGYDWMVTDDNQQVTVNIYMVWDGGMGSLT